MKLAGLDRANDLMRAVLSDTGEENKVYLSAMVLRSQKDLIEELARLNRANQADVLRAIIDEWRQHRLKVHGS
jgi:glutamate mutase epsilon subunit